MHQETHSNFFRNFCKKTSVHRGSDSKNRGVHSKKLKKNQKKTKAHDYEAQTHATWWIRILRVPQRRWIDLDPPIPRSNGQGRRKLDRVWTDPVQRAYIKGFGPVQVIFFLSFSFFFTVLSSSLVLSSSPTNPNPSLF